MDHRGFGLAETLAAIAVLLVIVVVAGPSFLTFLAASRLDAGAREVVAVLNRGRQIAISEGTPVCVEVGGAAVRFWPGGACGAGAAWVGVGSDGGGWIGLATGVRPSAPINVVFSPLGGATPGATLTVTHPLAAGTRSVVVAVSGRVRVR